MKINVNETEIIVLLQKKLQVLYEERFLYDNESSFKLDSWSALLELVQQMREVQLKDYLNAVHKENERLRK